MILDCNRKSKDLQYAYSNSKREIDLVTNKLQIFSIESIGEKFGPSHPLIEGEKCLKTWTMEEPGASFHMKMIKLNQIIFFLPRTSLTYFFKTFEFLSNKIKKFEFICLPPSIYLFNLNFRDEKTDMKMKYIEIS